MNELIKIDTNNDRITISARELHEELEIKTAFKDWFPRMCEYGFEEMTDFNPLKKEQVRLEGKREVKRTIQDYQLTIDMAKEIAMLQRNAKGKEIRTRLIQLEKDWNSPEKVMSRALLMAQNKINYLENTVDGQKAEIKELKPGAEFAKAVSDSNGLITVSDLAKLLQQNGIEMGQQRLFEQLRKRNFLCTRQSVKNLPTQYSMERGLFKIKETVSTDRYGNNHINRKTMVTGKGQRYFVKLFLKEQKEEYENMFITDEDCFD